LEAGSIWVENIELTITTVNASTLILVDVWLGADWAVDTFSSVIVEDCSNTAIDVSDKINWSWCNDTEFLGAVWD